MSKRIQLDELLSIVAFCVMMESDGGIAERSPDYIEEKFRLLQLKITTGELSWSAGLHPNLAAVVVDWYNKWVAPVTPESPRQCPDCGTTLEEIPGTEGYWLVCGSCQRAVHAVKGEVAK